MASPTRARRTESANSCRPRRITADRLSPMPCSTSSSSKVSSSPVNRVGTGVVTRISIRPVEQQAKSVPESGGSRRFQILDMFALLIPDPSGDPPHPDGRGGRVGEAAGSCRSTIECCGRGDRRSAGCAAVDGADTVATPHRWAVPRSAPRSGRTRVSGRRADHAGWGADRGRSPTGRPVCCPSRARWQLSACRGGRVGPARS